MINYNLGKIAEIVNGKLYGNKDDVVEGVQIDSRLATGKEIFVPFKGANVDGHDFVKQLLDEKRIAVSFWDNKEKEIPEGNIIAVEDNYTALRDLAVYYRNHISTTIVGITGSSGKTSTKDIIAATLSSRYKVHKTFANKNNEIGVPLTILQTDDDCDFAIVEMGISDFGEMDEMVDIVTPDVTVITCIAEAHIQMFRHLDNTSIEKCRINSRLGNGQAFYALNGHNVKENLEKMNLENKAISYGFEQDADVRAYDYRLAEKGSEFRTNLYPDFVFSLPILGKHQVTNALSAVAICNRYGLTAEEIQKGFDSIELTPHRLQIKNIKGAIVIDDSYNANPASMLASLQTVKDVDSSLHKIACLGDMLELGEEERNLHASLADRFDFHVFDRIYLYGSIMSALKEKLDSLGIESVYFTDFDKLEQALLPELKKGNLLLFKASNSMKFSKLIDELEEL